MNTKEKMLNLAVELIENDGIDSFNMRWFGNQLNLSRSAIYKHFKNKNDLIAAVTIHNFNELSTNILHYKPYKSTKEAVTRLLYDYFDYGIHSKNRYQLMYLTSWEDNIAVRESAMNFYHNILIYISKCSDITYSEDELMTIVSICFSFINGLVSLQMSGHNESEKNLNDPYKLISTFIDRFIY